MHLWFNQICNIISTHKLNLISYLLTLKHFIKWKIIYSYKFRPFIFISDQSIYQRNHGDQSFVTFSKNQNHFINHIYHTQILIHFSKILNVTYPLNSYRYIRSKNRIVPPLYFRFYPFVTISKISKNIQDPIPSLPYGTQNLNQIIKLYVVTSSIFIFISYLIMHRPMTHTNLFICNIYNSNRLKIILSIQSIYPYQFWNFSHSYIHTK